MKNFKYYTAVFVFIIIGIAFIFTANEKWQQAKEPALKTNKEIIIHNLSSAVYQRLNDLKTTLELHSAQTLNEWRVTDSLGTVIIASSAQAILANENLEHTSLNIMIRGIQDMWSSDEVITDNLLVEMAFKKVQPTNVTLLGAFTLFFAYIVLFMFSHKLLSDSFIRKRAKHYQKISNQAELISTLTRNKDDLTQQLTSLDKNQSQLTQSIAALDKEKDALIAIINKQRIGKSLFVADLCHEIKTPLTSLYAMMNMVTDPQKWQIHGPKIQRNQLLLSSFLEDFIELAKSDNGEFSVNKTWCDLNSVIEEAIDIAASLNSNRREIVFTHTTDDVECLTDALRMKQICINLLTNAMKYGGNFVHLDISFDLARKENLILSVRDFGKGIPHDTKEKIFQAFERGRLNENDDYEGIGLGLHIISNICNSLGATLNVYDAIPQGSIFEVRMQCDTRQLNQPSVDNMPSNIAFIGDKSPIRLALSQAYSDGAFIDSFVDESSFLEHLECETATYDLIVSHGTHSHFRQDLEHTLQGNKFNLVELSNPCTYHQSVSNQGASLGRLTPTGIKQLIGDINCAHPYRGNVLLLDDTPSNTLPIRQMTQNDYTLITVDNIHDAIFAAKATTFSLILVDLKLFDGELGYDFITRCRLFGKNKQTKIYAYTASSVSSLLDFCILAGADNILEKPVAQHLTIKSLIAAPASSHIDIKRIVLPEKLLTLSGASFMADAPSWQRQINVFLSRENATVRTIFDEVFSYILTLKNDPDCEKIVDYLMSKLHDMISSPSLMVHK